MASRFWRKPAQFFSTIMISVWSLHKSTTPFLSLSRSDACLTLRLARRVSTFSSSGNYSSTTLKCFLAGLEIGTIQSRRLARPLNVSTNSYSVFWFPLFFFSYSWVRSICLVRGVPWSASTQSLRVDSIWTYKSIRRWASIRRKVRCKLTNWAHLIPTTTCFTHHYHTIYIICRVLSWRKWIKKCGTFARTLIWPRLVTLNQRMFNIVFWGGTQIVVCHYHQQQWVI